MKKEKVLNNINTLYGDIDSCIDMLLKGRVSKDEKMEGDAYVKMEGLMVACQQELSFLYDYIKDDLIEKEDDKAGSN